MVSFRDPWQSPIDACLAGLGSHRAIAVTTPNFASNVASIKGTDLIMSLPSGLASNTGLGDTGLRDTGLRDVVQFDPPLDVTDHPYSIIWHARSDQDQAMIWPRGIAVGLLA
jgi:hypothetical protein